MKICFSPKDKVHQCVICPTGPAMVWVEIIIKIYISQGCLKDQRG